jgi:glycerol-3-phosphate acyltransferase PlsY
MNIEFITACAIAAFAAYLLGGINSAIIMSKLVYGEDIREKGSGNPGFTNFKRVYGLSAVAWSVMILDILKTAVPVCIAMIAFGSMFGMGQFGAAFTGLFGMLGHCFPVWYGFKGGKAFMAGFGTIWFVDWRMALTATVVFLILLFTVKYMSVSACISSAVCPITLLLLGAQGPEVLIVSALSALLVIVRHSENFKKLMAGTESKFSFKHSAPPEQSESQTEQEQ